MVVEGAGVEGFFFWGDFGLDSGASVLELEEGGLGKFFGFRCLRLSLRLSDSAIVVVSSFSDSLSSEVWSSMSRFSMEIMMEGRGIGCGPRPPTCARACVFVILCSEDMDIHFLK